MVVNVHDASRKGRRRARKSRAFLNGREVTRTCFYADTKRGIVRCFKYCFRMHEDGALHIGLRGPHAWEERHGVVRVISGTIWESAQNV